MTTTVNKPLIDSKTLETALTTQYTAGSGVRAQIDKFTATNTTGAAITITLHLVPPAGTADATNKIISAVSVGAGLDTSLASVAGQTLAAGGAIAAVASATGLVIRCTGRETTG